MKKIIQHFQKGIIVSVQATHGEPLNHPDYLCALAEAALQGGACAVRMAQRENILAFKKKHPHIPVIGITKPKVIPANACELVYITPTFADIKSLADCCDVVALDATLRPRPNGETLENMVAETRKKFPNLALMADVASLDEGINAVHLGFDLISTTLSGYTQETRQYLKQGPDFELLQALVANTSTPIILEGRVWDPSEVTRAFEQGAFGVVIGSAVTRPHEITRRFVQAIP